MTTDRTSAPPELGLVDAIALIVGIVIGAGIFQTPPIVASLAGSAGAMYAAWILGGVASIAGALCYAELATSFPSRGGEYHFLDRAFGSRTSFLFGWSRISVIATGSIALLAFVVGDYLTEVVRLGPHSSVIYAVAITVLLTAVNLRGIRAGARTQNALTALKVVGLVAVAAAAVSLWRSGVVNERVASMAGEGATKPSTFGLATVFVLLTYGGWNDAAYVSAELRGSKTMVRALVLGLGIVMVLYLLVVSAFSVGLGFSKLSASKAAATDLVGAAYGSAAGTLVSLLVAVSTASAINATIIAGARSTYAFARDWPFLGALATWEEKRGVPANAMIAQAVIALVLIALGAIPQIGGGFKSMVELTAPVFWLFFLMCGISLFVLRRREPSTPRPFRVPLYPLVPALFCAICLFMLGSSLSFVYDHELGGVNAAWIGVAILSIGALLHALVKAKPASPR